MVDVWISARRKKLGTDGRSPFPFIEKLGNVPPVPRFFVPVSRVPIQAAKNALGWVLGMSRESVEQAHDSHYAIDHLPGSLERGLDSAP
jgi:hypothetical protein